MSNSLTKILTTVKKDTDNTEALENELNKELDESVTEINRGDQPPQDRSEVTIQF